MKLTRGDIVHMDTNAIAVAHDAKAWNALRDGFRLVTAKKCGEEATRPNALGASLTDKTLVALTGELTVREPSPADRLQLREALGKGIALDPGELDLLALARRETERVWHLCGPDRATLRALHHLGLVDRMVSLEEMCLLVGAATGALPFSTSRRWLSEKRTKLALGEQLL